MWVCVRASVCVCAGMCAGVCVCTYVCVSESAIVTLHGLNINKCYVFCHWSVVTMQIDIVFPKFPILYGSLCSEIIFETCKSPLVALIGLMIRFHLSFF